MRIIKDKIRSKGELKKIIPRLKKRGYKVAFTNGCFDIIHYGHVNYLERAKRSADILIVAVNSDSSVKRIKSKGRPIITLKNRMRTIAALESVDFVTSFNQDTPFEMIKLLRPDILVKGGDWNKDKIVGRDLIKSLGGKVVVLPYIKGHSSSKIIKQIGKIF